MTPLYCNAALKEMVLTLEHSLPPGPIGDVFILYHLTEGKTQICRRLPPRFCAAENGILPVAAHHGKNKNKPSVLGKCTFGTWHFWQWATTELSGRWQTIRAHLQRCTAAKLAGNERRWLEQWESCEPQAHRAEWRAASMFWVRHASSGTRGRLSDAKNWDLIISPFLRWLLYFFSPPYF